MPRPKLHRTCGLWWCNDDHYAGGLCQSHYRRKERHGNPVGSSEEIRFLLHTIKVLSSIIKDAYKDREIPDSVQAILHAIDDP